MKIVFFIFAYITVGVLVYALLRFLRHTNLGFVFTKKACKVVGALWIWCLLVILVALPIYAVKYKHNK